MARAKWCGEEIYNASSVFKQRCRIRDDCCARDALKREEWQAIGTRLAPAIARPFCLPLPGSIDDGTT